MKRFILIIILACTYSMCQAQDALFKKYSGTKGVENVYISKTLLSLMPKSALGDKHVARIAGKLDYIRILESEKKSLIPAIVKDAEKIYGQKDYEVVMEENEDDEHVVIYLRKLKKDKNEFVIFNHEKDEIQVVCIVGNITFDDIKDLDLDV